MYSVEDVKLVGAKWIPREGADAAYLLLVHPPLLDPRFSQASG